MVSGVDVVEEGGDLSTILKSQNSSYLAHACARVLG